MTGAEYGLYPRRRRNWTLIFLPAVENFIEKLTFKTAERYDKEGYLWNSGNFMFRAGLLRLPSLESCSAVR